MSAARNEAILFFFTLAAFALQHATALPAEPGSTDRKIVILKLDDVVADPRGKAPVSARWQRVADYLKHEQIHGSFGVICASLEKDNPAYFNWIRELQASGRIEFWLHGYFLRKAADPVGEFEQGTAAEQQAVLEKSERLAKDKLGFPLVAFGPHWSGTTEATDAALQAIDDIQIWLYGPPRPKHFRRLSIERLMGLENPTFVPDPAKFKKDFERLSAQHDVFVLQGHPDQWTDERWADFVEIIQYLKAKDVEFLTPSEYLKRAAATNKLADPTSRAQ